MVQQATERLRAAAQTASPGRVMLLCLAGVALVGYIDWLSGAELALSILYLIPIGICAWFAGFWPGIGASLMAAMIWTSLDIMDGRPYSNPLIPYWNGLVRLSIFIVVTVLLRKVRTLTLNLHELVRIRTAALQNEIDQRKELERMVTQISAREQQRLAGELHDQLAGHLAGTAFLAKALSESLIRKEMPEAPDARKLVESVNSAHRLLRGLCRLLAPVDSSSGLDAGLSKLGAEMESTFGVTCIVQTPRDAPELDLDRARLLYNIAQETVRRAVEKRKASHVEISLFHDTSNLKLVISDDGVPPPERDGDSFDLRIMRYRAETLGGEIVTHATSPAGSVLACTVPMNHPTMERAPAL